MPQTIQQVQPGLSPITPSFNATVVKLIHWTLPLFLRFHIFPWLPARINQIEVVNGETLLDCYHQFQTGKIRLILAFRHVEVDDPLCGLYLLSRSLPQLAKTVNMPLQRPLHAHFLYDRGMPLWGGTGLGWLLSRFGGVSLHRGKRPDWHALRTARELMVNGHFPFAIAPEGATNGHSEQIGPLEPGVAQLGFWCVEDLQKADRHEMVWMLPIGIQYFYQNAPWHRLDQLMSELEGSIGLPVHPIETVSDRAPTTMFYQRLLTIGEVLLSKLEQFYHQFYPESAPSAPPAADANARLDIGKRIAVLLDRALEVAEAYFGVTPTGTPVDRCRRLEEAAWTHIYRSDLAPRGDLSQLDRGLADWMAQEASLRMIHMRLAESFVAVSGSYVAERPSFERFAETTLIMFDALARIRGDKLPRRPWLGMRQARVTVSNPISVSDRWEAYHANRRAAKQAVEDLTQAIRTALEGTIV